MKQKWYLCNVCDMVCPQLSPDHHSAYCTCFGEETPMELLDEEDPKIQLKDKIIDTVEFILVRDADQETIKITERFIE